jgi:hypothetical protein
MDVSRIRAIHNTDDGPVLDWECWCGARGSLRRGVEPMAQRAPRDRSGTADRSGPRSLILSPAWSLVAAVVPPDAA